MSKYTKIDEKDLRKEGIAHIRQQVFRIVGVRALRVHPYNITYALNMPFLHNVIYGWSLNLGSSFSNHELTIWQKMKFVF